MDRDARVENIKYSEGICLEASYTQSKSPKRHKDLSQVLTEIKVLIIGRKGNTKPIITYPSVYLLSDNLIKFYVA